ncbi:unnamed protein product [Hymenolepis diminuta]|uniref:EGF-like domain-containing protein n=1 Tax=Hymenolepis diminuta TaxID=6216 RepID=A0A0R3SY35_HYMDI|nr:unnamed protein product [Hymenolepis diminuta]VUZ54808.1 unnamed protein product [Hymenolepis diminuta]
MPIFVFLFLCLLHIKSSESSCDLCRSVLEQYRSSFSEIDPDVSLGGGNTDWEEKFIGKYAFSELHAFETLERTLKRLDSRQAHFLSDIEPDIEEFWAEQLKTGKVELSNIVDIFCNDKLKYCCPFNTFGVNCSNCDPCNIEHGQCDGNGTRSGNGKCVCQKGYSGSTCDECNPRTHFQSFFENGSLNCIPCHPSCSGGCSDETESSCVSCAHGFSLVEDNDGKKSCQDIDECEKSPCKWGTFCINQFGTYSCNKCPTECKSCKSSSECTTCASGYELKSGKCIDIDECADVDICSGPHEKCVNRQGSYRCVCEEGYRQKQGICIPSPRKSSTTASRGKWTPQRTMKLLVEFGKLMAFLVAFGVVTYFISRNWILSSSLAVFAVAVICYQADVLDNV